MNAMQMIIILLRMFFIVFVLDRGIYSYLSLVIHIASLDVCISTPNHSMQIKMMVCLWHRTKNTFVLGQPGKRLFTTHCVKLKT